MGGGDNPPLMGEIECKLFSMTLVGKIDEANIEGLAGDVTHTLDLVYCPGQTSGSQPMDVDPLVEVENNVVAGPDMGVVRSPFYDADGPVFTTDMIHFMLNEMGHLSAQGGLWGTRFDSKVMTKLQERVVERFNIPVTVKQVNAKYHRIKKDYVDFIKLKQHFVGDAWNHELNVPACGEDEWDNYCQIHADCKKFRNATLPNYEVLKAIFEPRTSFGVFGWAKE